MNPLVILPLLAAACLAAPAPGNLVQSGVIGLGGLTLAQPQLTQLTYSAPAVAHVQVPLTKTVHYETKPVVTGYSTSIIKPAIASGVVAAPALAYAPQQQVLVQEQKAIVAQPAQVAVQAPAQDAVVVEARSAAPIALAQPQLTLSAAPVVQQQVVQQQLVSVRAAQAGDFGPLVTKEKVLAPVRTHTQITPQVTQIQPEVTVRKVIQEVNVAQPIAVQTPVTYAVNSPVLAGASVLNGQVINGQYLNGQVINGQLLNGQVINGASVLNGQLLNGQVINGASVLNGQVINGLQRVVV